MKKTKAEPKRVVEIETPIDTDAKKAEVIVSLLYEKVSRSTGKSIDELKKSTITIQNGVISLKEVKHE